MLGRYLSICSALILLLISTAPAVDRPPVWLDYHFDEDLTQIVQMRLQTNPCIEDDSVYVTVYTGHVYLSGSVDSLFEHELATDIAGRVPGTVAVYNNMQIVPMG